MRHHSLFTIEALMQQYYPYVCRLAYSILGDPDDAEDAAQETFIRAALHMDDFRGEADQRTWLYAIAVNVCRTELRKRKRRLALEAALTSLQSLFGMLSAEETAIKEDARANLIRAIDGLDEKHRIPLVLRYVEQMTAPQIAAVLNISEGTVHSRLHFAREKLARRLGTDLQTVPQAASVARKVVE